MVTLMPDSQLKLWTYKVIKVQGTTEIVNSVNRNHFELLEVTQ